MKVKYNDHITFELTRSAQAYRVELAKLPLMADDSDLFTRDWWDCLVFDADLRAQLALTIALS